MLVHTCKLVSSLKGVLHGDQGPVDFSLKLETEFGCIIGSVESLADVLSAQNRLDLLEDLFSRVGLTVHTNHDLVNVILVQLMYETEVLGILGWNHVICIHDHGSARSSDSVQGFDKLGLEENAGFTVVKGSSSGSESLDCCEYIKLVVVGLLESLDSDLLNHVVVLEGIVDQLGLFDQINIVIN